MRPAALVLSGYVGCLFTVSGFLVPTLSHLGRVVLEPLAAAPTSEYAELFSKGAGKGQQAAMNQIRQFHRIKDAGGLITDIYAREAADDKFYFAGKLATGVISLDQAIALQLELIIDHIRKVVPDLPADVQIFTAPGGSEMKVAQNQMRLRRAVASIPDLSQIKNLREIGFMPEIYERAERVSSLLVPKRAV